MPVCHHLEKQVAVMIARLCGTRFVEKASIISRDLAPGNKDKYNAPSFGASNRKNPPILSADSRGF